MPSDKSSIIEKAQKLAAKGQLDKAIDEWQKLIAETPNDGNIYNTIGDLHLKANHIQESVVAYLKAAEAFKAAGFELKSIAVFKKIIKIDPARMDVFEKLADVHAERGLTGNAIEDYLKVAKHYTKAGDIRSALSVYRKLANLDPQNAAVRLKIAEMCQKEGLQKEAIEEYEKVLGIYQGQQKTAEAKEIFGQILKMDPAYKGAPPAPGVSSGQPVAPDVDAPQPLLERWEAVLQTGEWEKAEPILRELTDQGEFSVFLSNWVDRYPEQISARQLLGQRLEKEGKTEKATDCYSNILSLLLQQGPPDKSKAYYEEIKARLPGIADVGKWKSMFEPEEAPPEASPIEAGLESLTENVAVDPQPVAESEPIEIAGAEEVPEKAQARQSAQEKRPAPLPQTQEAEAAASLAPEISEATLQGHLTEAEVYIKYGLHSKAIEQLRMISELAPSREEPHLQLKELYLKEGMTQKAVGECWVLARLYEKKGADDKRAAILTELSLIDPEAARRGEEPVAAEARSDESAEVLSFEQGEPEEVFEVKEKGADLAAEIQSDQEIDLQSVDPEEDRQGIKEKMAQVEKYLQEGRKDAAKKLLWKIMEENSSYTEARLKLLEIQELSQKEKVPTEVSSPAAPSSKDLVEAGLEETSFEGLSEVLDQSFSDLISNEDPEASEGEGKAEVSLGGGKQDSEEFADLTSIFSEEVQQEENDETIDFSGIGLEDAFKQLQKGAQGHMNQEEFETHYNLGIAYKEMGLIPEAIKEFELAFQGEHRFLDASLMLAHCYQQRGMIDTGIEILLNALEDPRCDKENILALKYELASLFYQKGIQDKARALYEEIYRLDPQFRDIGIKIDSFERAPVPSASEEVKPKRPPDTKKKGRISYL